MTAPERKIRETEDILDKYRVFGEVSDQEALQQILSNQFTLLRAVKVQLVWEDE